MAGRTTIGFVERQDDEFRRRVLGVSSTLCFAVCVLGVIVHTAVGTMGPRAYWLVFATLCSGGAILAHWRGKTALGSLLLVAGGSLVLFTNMVLWQGRVAGATAATVILAAVGFILLSHRWALLIASGGVVATALSSLSQILGDNPIVSDAAAAAVAFAVIHIVAVAIIIWLYAYRSHRYSQAFGSTLRYNDELFATVPRDASGVAGAVKELLAGSQQQKEAELRQSAGINETKTALRSLLDSSGGIVAKSRETLDDALATLDHAERARDAVDALSKQTRRIARILETIESVASKSDMLSLSAALEATRAGPARAAFEPVAQQMEDLTRSVGASAKEIQALTKDIGKSAGETQVAMVRAVELAEATREAAQQISLISQQQRSGVEQVSAAMDDISEITTTLAGSNEQSTAAIDDLWALSNKLTELVRQAMSEAE